MNIGKTLQRIRIEKHITKQELCRRTGCNRGYIYRLEHDIISPSIAMLSRYVAAIGIPLWRAVYMAEHPKIDYGQVRIEDVLADWDEAAETPQC